MTGKWIWMVLVGFVLLAVHPSQAQVPPDSAYEAAIRQGIDHVYNLEFEKADEQFSRLLALHPRHPAGHFFHAMVTWWRILIDIDNTQYDDQFFAELDAVEEMCDSILDEHPDDVTAIFFKGGSIGFEGRLRFHRDDWLAAANAGRKALPLVQKANELDPNNYDIYLGTGIYDYYAEVIPHEYPLAKPLLLFIPPGDRAKGLQQLTLASQKAKYAGIESAYFLMQTYYSYERDFGKALELACNLHGRYPHNMLFHRYVGRCYVSLNEWQKARETFEEILGRVQRQERGYTTLLEREAEYYLGMADMNDRRNEEALRHFYRCDELSRTLDRKETSGFMVMANLKVGMIYDLQARRDLAVNQYQKVRGMKEFKDSRVQAEQFLKNPYR
jgi:tetratricopeptide (TPR) repeat protein